MTVREAEMLARKVAQDKVRKKSYIKDPNIVEIESSLAEKLGTRVHIEKRDVGGVITIDFFSYDDLESIVDQIKKARAENAQSMADKLKNAVVNVAPVVAVSDVVSSQVVDEVMQEIETENDSKLTDDRGIQEVKQDDNTEDDDLYNLKNFVI
jgi:hypothetical protein